MRLGDRVPVDPLTPERLDRLERRVVAAAGPALARPARPALWPWGLALASAAAAALAVIALRPAAPPPPAGAPVAVTTDDRGATLALGEATLVAGPETAFELVREDGGLEVLLDRGQIHLDVTPRRDRPPVWVRAGEVAVRVVGTAFSVRRGPGGEIAVEVIHGTVEVHRAGAIAAVSGGQRWSSRDGAVLALATTGAEVAAGPAGAPAGRDATGAAGLGRDDRHAPDLATGPAIDVAVLDERRSPIALPGPSAGDRGGDREPGGRTPRAARVDPATVHAPAAPAGDLRAEIRAQRLAPATVDGDADAATRAAALRRRAATSVGAEAAAALYALARTEHLDLGQHGPALRTLDAYLKRFPGGAEREAVDWLRLRILCRDQFDDRCRAAAYAYVDRHRDAAGAELRTRVDLAGRVPLQR